MAPLHDRRMDGTKTGPDMAKAIIWITLVLGLATAPAALGQMTTDDLIDPGPKDSDVSDAFTLERLQSDVKYLRPDAEFRPGEDIKVVIPDKPATPAEQRSTNRTTSGIVAFIFIAIVIVVLVLFGNRINVSFGKTSEKKRRQQEAASSHGTLVDVADLPKSGLLDHLAAMPDRRRALILLTGLSLELNGLTLARAQTARDVLRILPRQWTHLGAVRQLVREAEIVHFGGRDLAEDTWRACLDAARPLFAGQEAPA